MSVWRRFLRLTPERRRLYLEAWRAVWAVRLLLWRTPRSRVREVLGIDREAGGNSVIDATAVRTMAQAVDAVAQFVPGGACLVRALALHGLLGRRGQTSVVRLGVARRDGALEAHAWLEVPGVGDLGRNGRHLEFVPLRRCARPAGFVRKTS